MQRTLPVSGRSAVAPARPVVPPLPSRRPNPLNWALTLAALGVVWWSAAGTGFSLAAPFAPENTKSVARFLGGAFPPDLSPAFLRAAWHLVVQTIQISIAGTVLAVVCAAPLAFLAMRRTGEEFAPRASGRLPWMVRWASYSLARSILNVLRAVPELVWALVFVVAVGLGPYPGVLALAAHSTGVLGKLYAELFESVDDRLVEAGRATGASEPAVLLLVRVPAMLPVLLSYTLFRWECNMRAATVLGFVGAGGIGTQLSISMKLFQYNSVLTLALILLALVVLVDLAGQVIRQRLLHGGGAMAAAQELPLLARLIRFILESATEPGSLALPGGARPPTRAQRGGQRGSPVVNGYCCCNSYRAADERAGGRRSGRSLSLH